MLLLGWQGSHTADETRPELPPTGDVYDERHFLFLFPSFSFRGHEVHAGSHVVCDGCYICLLEEAVPGSGSEVTVGAGMQLSSLARMFWCILWRHVSFPEGLRAYPRGAYPDY